MTFWVEKGHDMNVVVFCIRSTYMFKCYPHILRNQMLNLYAYIRASGDLYRCPRQLGDELGRIDAAAFDVAGVTLSAPQARFVWPAWHFRDLYRCLRKLGDELGRIDAAAFDVAGVTLSAPQARFVWLAWRFRVLYRCPQKLGDELGRIDAAAFDVAGMRLSAPESRFVWLAWPFRELYRCPRKLGDELGRIDAAAFDVAGVTLSAPQARHFRDLYRCPRKLGDELGRITPLHLTWQAWRFQHLRLDLCGRRGAFGSFIDVRGSLATNWVGLMPLHLTWQAWHLQPLMQSWRDDDFRLFPERWRSLSDINRFLYVSTFWDMMEFARHIAFQIILTWCLHCEAGEMMLPADSQRLEAGVKQITVIAWRIEPRAPSFFDMMSSLWSRRGDVTCWFSTSRSRNKSN